MRACFLGQNICALGYGVATLRTPPLVMDKPLPPDGPAAPKAGENVSPAFAPALPHFPDTHSVANSQRLPVWSGLTRHPYNHCCRCVLSTATGAVRRRGTICGTPCLAWHEYRYSLL